MYHIVCLFTYFLHAHSRTKYNNMLSFLSLQTDLNHSSADEAISDEDNHLKVNIIKSRLLGNRYKVIYVFILTLFFKY